MTERPGVEEPLRGGNVSARVVGLETPCAGRPVRTRPPSMRCWLICTGSGSDTHRVHWASTTGMPSAVTSRLNRAV
jgi:hypothetical protein